MGRLHNVDGTYVHATETRLHSYIQKITEYMQKYITVVFRVPRLLLTIQTKQINYFAS